MSNLKKLPEAVRFKSARADVIRFIDNVIKEYDLSFIYMEAICSEVTAAVSAQAMVEYNKEIASIDEEPSDTNE